MPYAQLLADLINKKNLTVKEVAERCKSHGVDITASYISILKNPDNEKTPSDEVSRALAKACEAEYLNCLVIEAYIDKAPEEFNEVFDLFKNNIIQSILLVFQNKFSEEQISIVLDRFKKMPMFEFINLTSKIYKNQAVMSSKSENSENVSTTMFDNSFKVIAELRQPEGMKVSDDSMEPIISNGNMVFPEVLELKDYKNGDIIIAKLKDAKLPIVRKCIFNDDRSAITLFAYSNKVAPQTIDTDQVSIIGKVKRIITDL